MPVDEAPPIDDDTALAELDTDQPEPTTPAPVVRARKRRRRRRRPSVPFPSELGLLLLAVFVLWWSTRSWILAGLLVVVWIGVLLAYRAVHRMRRSNLDRRRFSRERLFTAAVIVFVVGSGLAGLRAWSHRDPVIPRRDPPGPYALVEGAAVSGWETMYHREAVVRSIGQPTTNYWVLILEDSEGCWSQSLIIGNGLPVVAGERTPAPCPVLGYVPSLHGDQLDPARVPVARVALDFAEAWLSEGNFPIYVAPGAQVNALGRTVDVSDLTAYPISGEDDHAVLWVEASTDDGPIGMRLTLTADHGRWFVAALQGAPAVDPDANLHPLPANSTTTAPTTTTTTR